MKNKIFYLWGAVVGILNGLLGAGGGMVAVPALRTKMSAKEAHATSVSVILPICVVSALFYIQRGSVTIPDALPYLIWGIIGSVIGTFILKKLSGKALRKIFALFMLWAGIRLIMR